MSNNQSIVGANHHVTPIWHYAVNFVALFVLMTLTVVASRINIGTLGNNLVAYTIAAIKACLILWIFMGLRSVSRLSKIWGFGMFIWLILLFGILADYKTRLPVEGFHHDAGPALREGDAIKLAPSPGDDGGVITPGVPKSD